MNIDKNSLLKSKIFCMLPWVHLNVTPKGDAYPCCATDYSTPVGNTREQSLKEIFNGEKLKQMRLDMINQVPVKMCQPCYTQEKFNAGSFRINCNNQFSKYFDETVMRTETDGTVADFKMRYLDIRFSNICNFKCRLCGSEFSSQAAAEMQKHLEPEHPIVIHADQTGSLLSEVFEHLPHLDLAYFAGGEPLITDEHYVILEELIKLNKTDITLRYSSNCSGLKYKNYDILELWSHFKKIEFCASIDHYGKKAEYIRKGTDWEQVEFNLLKLRMIPNIDFKIHTVVSIFNYVTMADFYSHLIEKQIIRPDDCSNSQALTENPTYFKTTNLPIELKKQAEMSFEKFKKDYPEYTALHNLMNEAVAFTNAAEYYDDMKIHMNILINERDNWRNENFLEVFPELGKIING